MVTVICGPPCAGKTTLARRLAQPGDVVLDFDDVCVELGSRDQWSHPKPIREQAEALMRHRIRQLAYDCDAAGWVIRTAPHPAQRRRLAEQLNATVWVLDPGMATCLARAAAGGRPRGTGQAIRAWYARYVRDAIDQAAPVAPAIPPSPPVTSRVW